MLKIQYPHSIAAVLLGACLLQGCQSNMNVLPEEGSPEEQAIIRTVPSATFPAPWPSHPEPLSHNTSTRTISPNQASLFTFPSFSLTPGGLTYKVFTASSGERIRFRQVHGRWQAELQPVFPTYPKRTLPIASPAAIGPQLAWLHSQDVWVSKARIHVLPTPQSPYQDCVYVGKLGLLGGMAGEDKDSESSQQQHHLNTIFIHES